MLACVDFRRPLGFQLNAQGASISAASRVPSLQHAARPARGCLRSARCESLSSSEAKSFHGLPSSVSFVARAVRDGELSCVDFHRPRVVGSPGRLGADLSVTHRPARPPACDREGLPVTYHSRCVLRAACCARARAVGCVRGPALCVGCASPAGLARI